MSRTRGGIFKANILLHNHCPVHLSLILRVKIPSDAGLSLAPRGSSCSKGVCERCLEPEGKYLMSSFHYIINILPSHLSLILRVKIPSDAGLSLAPRGSSCSKGVCERCLEPEGKYLMSSFYYIINLLPSHLSLILRVKIPSDAGLSLAPRGSSCSKGVCERCLEPEGKYLMSSFYYIINFLPSHLSLILRVQIPSDAGLSLAPRGFSCSKGVCERCWGSEGKIFNIVILLHNRCSVHLSLILRVQIPSDAVSVFGAQMVLVLKGSL